MTPRNVRAQCEALQAAFPVDPELSRSLIWLPWFHDYGLIHGVIQPAYTGAASFIMPTTSFLRDPLRWLTAVSAHRITHTGAPNFAYQACLQALGRNQSWSADLSSLEVASCGAEPIRSQTLTGFAESFAPFGFQAEALAPSYGLAESVLCVTASRGVRTLTCDRQALERGEVCHAGDDASAYDIVGCGSPLPGTEVRIVDPETNRAMDSGRVGEIWVSGPSVAEGYWADPASTAETFGWKLTGGSPGSFLRTGDLGFFESGELYVTGRRKDLLLINGRNLYPQDLEASAALADPAIRPAGTMAVRVTHDGLDRVVVLAECAGRPDSGAARRISDAVRRHITADHAVDIEDIVLLRAGSLPRTSSGKPQRAHAAKLYVSGALEQRRFVAAVPDTNDRATADEIFEVLQEIWSAVLDVSVPGPDANFFELGGDSLLATQVVSRIHERLSLEVTIGTVFEAPTLAELAVRVLYAKVAENELAVDPSGADSGALSFSQERMWFMHKLAPRSAAYNVPLAIRLRGSLDESRLARAFHAVVRRHAVLRTRFVAEGAAVQAIVDDEANSPALQITDLSRLGGDAFAAAARHLRVIAAQPFELHRGPLLRAELLRLSDADHVLMIVMHHIVGDQWSCAVLGRELAHCYNAASSQSGRELPDLSAKYATYAAGHRRWFEETRAAIELDYWRSKLCGLEPLRLNEDFPRPAQQRFRGNTISVPLPQPLIDRLTSLASSRNASLSMVLIAALDALLHRHTGRTDIAVGVPIANRHHLLSEDLIGTFVNTLVFRTEVPADASFLEVLNRVRETALEAFEHQDMPFEKLVRELDLPHDPGQSPLFNVLFNMINTPVRDVEFDDVRWERLDVDRGASQFDLTVSIDAMLNRVVLFEYATDLFAAETIERLAAQYLRVLERIADAPQEPIATLPVVAGQERKLLESWGCGTPLDTGSGASCIIDLTAYGAREHPHNSAVVFRDMTLTHAELDSASNRLARLLRGRGIARGSRVAVCMGRGPDLVISLLGILKSGAAYVPLDPTYPRARLHFQARDAEVALLLADARGIEQLDWPPQDCLVLGNGSILMDGYSEAALPPDAVLDAGPTDPAYVIYTSGSTGNPKGVVVPHIAVVNFLASMAREPGLSPDDRLLAVTTFSFDIAVLELYLPLAVGACLIIAEDNAAADGNRLAELIRRHQVTVMQSTPSRWHLLLEAGWVGPGPGKALVGGEPLSPELAERLRATGAEVWNMYGPTETAVWSTAWPVHQREHPPISLGHPIANTTIEVLDERGELCPIGVPGEIWIGGAGLATGYLNNQELTASRFVTRRGQRQYGTGDLARWCHDGALEHLGRMDEQVKLRGHRIELGEIQAGLEAHHGVRQAVVALKTNNRGEAVLVAYLIGTDIQESALRQQLRGFLPEHMIPQFYVVLDAFPELPNGKIDRRGLPTPDLVLRPSVEEVAPRTRFERDLLRVWQDVLQVGDFGINRNFFDLGGHSLLGLELVRRIDQELGLACPIATLFHAPTVEGMARALSDTGSDAVADMVVTTECEGSGPTVFCLAGNHMYADLASYLEGDYRVLGLTSRMEVDLLERAEAPGLPDLRSLAEVYAKAIVELQPAGPYLLAGFSIGGVLAFEVARQLRARGEAVTQLIIIDSSLPGLSVKHLYRWLQKRIIRLIERAPTHYLNRAAEHVRRARRPRRTHSPTDLIQRNAMRRNGQYARLIRRYRPRGVYDAPMLFIQSAEDPIRVPAYGWAALAPDLQLVRVAGGHMQLLETPAVVQVASAMRAGLPSTT